MLLKKKLRKRDLDLNKMRKNYIGPKVQTQGEPSCWERQEQAGW